VKFLGKKWFTFTELIVAITISTILLIFIFKFVADTVNILSETTRKSRILVSFYEFVVRFDNYRNNFPIATIVKDFSQGYGYDVVLLKTFDSKIWVLFWVVNKDTMMLDGTWSYNQFWPKIVWFRELTQWDITSINSNPDMVYTYSFFEDKVFSPLIMRNFQTDLYNSGTIVDMNVWVLLSEFSGLEWTSWSQVPLADIYKVNLNF
jgi:hypothetical protein